MPVEIALAVAPLIIEAIKALGEAFPEDAIRSVVTSSLARLRADYPLLAGDDNALIRFLKHKETAAEMARLLCAPYEEPDPVELVARLDMPEKTELAVVNTLTSLFDGWAEKFCEACYQNDRLRDRVAPRLQDGPFKTIHVLQNMLFAHYESRFGTMPALGTFVSRQQAAVSLFVRLQDVYVPFRGGREMREGIPADDLSARDSANVTDQSDLSYSGALPPEATERVRVQAASRELGQRLRVQTLPVSLHDLWNQGGRVVIVGDPGSGKSTLLRYIALAFAQRRQQELLHCKNWMLPIIVSVCGYAEALSRKDGLEPLEYLATYCREHSMPGMKRLFDYYTRKGGALVMFDGLDEVVDRNHRVAVVSRIEGCIERHRANNSFIVTSRIIGYSEAPLSPEFTKLTVLSFDDTEVESFLTKWCKAFETCGLSADDPRCTEKQLCGETTSREIVSRIRNQPGIRKLATNPLQLTILAMIHYQSTRLPNRRVELYRSYVQVFAEAWHRARDIAKVPVEPKVRNIPIDEELVVGALGPVAFKIHCVESGGVISRSDLRDDLIEYFRDRRSLSHDESARAAEDFMRVVPEHVGFFVERGLNQFGFTHPTYEEYLAARYLSLRESEPRWKLIQPRLHAARWREVILLTIGSLEGEPVDALLERILMAGSEYESILRRDLLLVVRALADDPRIYSGNLRRSIIGSLFDAARATPYEDQRRDIAQVMGMMKGSASENSVRTRLELLLLEALPRAPWWMVRASRQIGLESQLVVGVLLNLLESEDANTRARAVGVIEGLSLNSEPVAQALLKLTDDKDADIRVRVAEVLVYLRPNSEFVAQALLRLTEDEESRVRARAAYSLRRLKQERVPVVGPLLRLLEDDDDSVRGYARDSLAVIGDSSELVTKQVFRLLEHSNGDIRAGAARALAMLEPKRELVVHALIRLLDDKDGRVREATIYALGRLAEKSEPVIQSLVKLFDDKESKVRISAAHVTVGLKVESKSIVHALLKLTEDREADVRAIAAYEFGRLGARSESVVQALLKLTEDGADEVRASAVRAIANLGLDSGPVTQVLRGLLGDRATVVRSRAAHALGELGVKDEDVMQVLLGLLEDEKDVYHFGETDALIRFGVKSASVVSTLQRLLSAERRGTQAKAAYVISQLGISSPEVLDALIKALAVDPEPDVLVSTGAMMRMSRDCFYDALHSIVGQRTELDAGVAHSDMLSR